METITQKLGNIKDSVLNTFKVNTTSAEPPKISKGEVLKLEENERSRRLQQVSQSRVDQQNAANISHLIKKEKFPVFRGNVSKGYKRVTTRFEEEERRRRLTNKAESSLRRNNANRTAHMIQALGWPFYKPHSGPEYIVMDPITILEEEERQRRTGNEFWAVNAKHNAAVIANILRCNNFQRNPNAGIRRYMRSLEEKERASRLDDSVFLHNMDNAYNESNLIRHLGSPFFAQQEPRDLSEIHKIEELERKRRLINPVEQQLAKELAGIVSASVVPGSREKILEEKERERRRTDFPGQLQAQRNARDISMLIRDNSFKKQLAGSPIWFTVSRQNIRAMEEVERIRRMRDKEGQRRSKLLAVQLSALVADMFANSARPVVLNLEEEERKRRILDRAQQHIAVKNARKVSGFIAKHYLFNPTTKSYALAMEESERARRLLDRDQEWTARANARKVSSLVSALGNSPMHHVSFPQQQAGGALLPAAVALPATTQPSFSSSPSGTIQNVQPSSATAGAPSTIPTITSVPYTSPSTSQLPTVQQLPAIVPVDTYITGQAPLLGERQLKRLTKEASRHARRSEKEIRKAETQLQKAEKMHHKGRDDVAAKLETKANYMMQLADHERKWADGLQSEIINPQAPAPAKM